MNKNYALFKIKESINEKTEMCERVIATKLSYFVDSFNEDPEALRKEVNEEILTYYSVNPEKPEEDENRCLYNYLVDTSIRAFIEKGGVTKEYIEGFVKNAIEKNSEDEIKEKLVFISLDEGEMELSKDNETGELYVRIIIDSLNFGIAKEKTMFDILSSQE